MLFSFRIHVGNFVLGDVRKVLLNLKSTKSQWNWHENTNWNSIRVCCCEMRHFEVFSNTVNSEKWDIPSFSLGMYCILYEVRSWIDRERKSIHQNAASGLSSISIFTIALRTRCRGCIRMIFEWCTRQYFKKFRKVKLSWARWFFLFLMEFQPLKLWIKKCFWWDSNLLSQNYSF